MRDWEIPRNTDYGKTDWHSVEATLGIVGKVERRLFQPGKGRVVFLCADVVWKVNLRYMGNCEVADFQCLANEVRFLQRLAPTGYVPDVLEFAELENMEALCLKRVNGLPLDEHPLQFVQFCLLQYRVVRAIHEFAKHRVAHGDLAPHNIFLERSGRLFFIDFGHAYDSSYLSAFFRSLFVKRVRHPGFNRPYLVTVVRLIEFGLPKRYQRVYRKILGIGEYTRTASYG